MSQILLNAMPSSSSSSSATETSLTLPFPSAGVAAVEATKASARASRLKLSNSLADKLYTEWQAEGLKVCAAQVRRYWLCRQAAGFAVVLPNVWGGCRDENASMHACLSSHAHDDDAFDVFRHRRLAEMADARDTRVTLAAAATASAVGAVPLTR